MTEPTTTQLTDEPPASGQLRSLEDVYGYVAMTLDNANGQTWTWTNDEVVGMLLDIVNGLTAEVEQRAAADVVTIPRPVVPFGPKHLTEDEGTAMYLRGVVRKHLPDSGGSSTIGGSNVTATVRGLLLSVAEVLDPAVGAEAVSR